MIGLGRIVQFNPVFPQGHWVSRKKGLRESVVIGHLRVVYNSAHRHPRMLKFSEKLLLTLTKTFFKTDFEILARGRFCSHFKTKKNFKKSQKLSKNVFRKSVLKKVLVRVRRSLCEIFSILGYLWAEL